MIEAVILINMNQTHPSKLSIRYEVGNTGYFFSLKWENNILVLKQFSEHDNKFEEEIQPNGEEWEDYLHYLNEIKVWDWYDEYLVNCGDSCVEGDEWEVSLVWGDLRMESHGANSYPTTFREFIKATEELTGILIEFIQQD